MSMITNQGIAQPIQRDVVFGSVGVSGGGGTEESERHDGKHFTLNKEEKKEIPATEDEWNKWFNNPDTDRVVADDEIKDMRVTTIFLGLNHAFEEGVRPLLYETMIFGGSRDGKQWKCGTYDEAEKQHKFAVKKVKQDATA